MNWSKVTDHSLTHLFIVTNNNDNNGVNGITQSTRQATATTSATHDGQSLTLNSQQSTRTTKMLTTTTNKSTLANNKNNLNPLISHNSQQLSHCQWMSLTLTASQSKQQPHCIVCNCDNNHSALCAAARQQPGQSMPNKENAQQRDTVALHNTAATTTTLMTHDRMQQTNSNSHTARQWVTPDTKHQSLATGAEVGSQIQHS